MIQKGASNWDTPFCCLSYVNILLTGFSQSRFNRGLKFSIGQIAAHQGAVNQETWCGVNPHGLGIIPILQHPIPVFTIIEARVELIHIKIQSFGKRDQNSSFLYWNAVRLLVVITFGRFIKPTLPRVSFVGLPLLSSVAGRCRPFAFRGSSGICRLLTHR